MTWYVHIEKSQDKVPIYNIYRMQLSVKIKQIDCLYLRRFNNPEDCLHLHELGRWDHISVSPLSCLAVLAVLAVALSASSAGHGLARSAPCRSATTLPHESPDLSARLDDALVSVLALPTLSCLSDPGLDALDHLLVHLGQVDPVLVLNERPVDAL